MNFIVRFKPIYCLQKCTFALIFQRSTLRCRLMFQISTFICFFFNFYYTPLFIQVKVSLRFKSHFQEGPGIVAAKVTKHDNIATIRTNMGKIRNSRSLRATFKTVTLTKRVILSLLEMHLNSFTATISDNQLYDVVRTKAVLVAV